MLGAVIELTDLLRRGRVLPGWRSERNLRGSCRAMETYCLPTFWPSKRVMASRACGQLNAWT